MKKYVEIRKIRRKTLKNYRTKYESEYVNKVKNMLKLNVDEQQDAIKHLKQGSSENDGRSDVIDRSEFMVISNCCYNNCCRTNCSHFYLYLPEYT